MDKYAAAGAKYFVSMGVHHDNFDLWNSKHHRWNAVAMGPKRDIVGAWRAAARKRGLRFGVSEHLGASHNWFHPSHLYNQTWPEPRRRSRRRLRARAPNCRRRTIGCPWPRGRSARSPSP